MNPRASLTIIGILIIILGIFPLVAKAIPVPSIQNFPIEAGSIVYQSVIIIIGILALFLSGKKKASAMPQIILKNQ